MEKKEINGKRRARKLAVQALYQWLMSGAPLYEIEAQFCAANNMDRVDIDYFRRLLHGVTTHLSSLDALFVNLLDRPIDQLNPIELIVLRISTFEFLHCLDIPYRVILDESVALTKTFGSQDGHRYVNGVLHHVAQTTRATEIGAMKDH